MAEKLDTILLGVTGFTGKNTLSKLYELAAVENRQLTWGVAGRNETKIREILDDLAKRTGDETISRKPIINVDLTQDESIKQMTSKTRLVINCCGPYRLLGEKVVTACLETRTHHVDVSGERLFMEKMQLLYNDKAKEAGLYIVSACGFGSIVGDLAAIFLHNKFKGTLNSIETFVKVESAMGNGTSGAWNSAIHEIADIKQLKSIRAKLYTEKLPPLKPKLKKRLIPFNNNMDKCWAATLLGPDHSVMLRTQRYLYEETKQRPAQIETYLLFENFISLIIIALTGLVFIILVRFEFGKYLLLKYPHIFSLGFIASTEPSEESIKKSKFSTTLIGKGWKDTVGADDVTKRAPNKGIVAQVKGTNPGYGTTAVCLVLAAIMILTEPSKLPKKGGVYSPGAAFAETSLIEQLHKNDVTFELIKEFDIVE